MPCGLVDGIPVGIEIIGAPLQELKVLNIAMGLESTAPIGNAIPTAYLN
jgi:Asp-tRNA(Asn)/Glu-tRNA(Gln) amidotransferase A subunit family amidase